MSIYQEIINLLKIKGLNGLLRIERKQIAPAKTTWEVWKIPEELQNNPHV